MGLDEAVQQIKKQFPQDAYGLGDLLVRNIQNDGFGLYLPYDNPRGHFDCWEASEGAKKILQKEGISSVVHCSRDESGLFLRHYFLVTLDEEIIDPTPLFPIIGAQHPDPVEVVGVYSKPKRLSIFTSLPMQAREYHTRKYISFVSAHKEPEFHTAYRLYELENRKPHRGLSLLSNRGIRFYQLPDTPVSEKECTELINVAAFDFPLFRAFTDNVFYSRNRLTF